jgi:predicted Fe-Mo cluster-binding NifX family protein
MKILISSMGKDLNSNMDPRFGRCQHFVLADSENKSFEVYDNPGCEASGGAGIKASQYAIELGAKAVISGHFGPNASDVLKGGEIAMYMANGDLTLSELIDLFNQGALEKFA